MSTLKFKDAKNLQEFDITVLKKGFAASSTVDGKEIEEFFTFAEIHKITHYPDTGVEIILLNGSVRVFYNGDLGASLNLFSSLKSNMTTWMDSNLN